MGLTLGDLKQIWGDPFFKHKVNFSVPLGTVCIDTRVIKKGDFFIPLKGENFNGHEFISHAYRCGAQAAVIGNDFEKQLPDGLLYWRVPDTLKAFQQLALLHRRDLGIPVIAVTGSVGKTTTREFIKEVLEPLGVINSSRENQNNDVGVPLTLLQTKASNAAVVLEMGMRGLGQIKKLSYCAEPDIAVITNIGTAHIGLLGSRKNIALAKTEITSCLNSSGVIIIPANDPLLEKTLSYCWKGRVVRVGIQDTSSFKEKDDKSTLEGIDLLGKLDLIKGVMEVDNKIFKLPLRGRHNAINLLLAIAVAKEFSIPLNQVTSLRVQLPHGRSRVLKMGAIKVLDETYNSSPESVKASLQLLSTFPGRKFAVLGTMLELGDYSTLLHREVLEYASKLNLDGLVFVAPGDEASVIRLESANFPKFEIVSKAENALEPISSWLESGDTVLLKASRSIELERLLPLMREIYS